MFTDRSGRRYELREQPLTKRGTRLPLSLLGLPIERVAATVHHKSTVQVDPLTVVITLLDTARKPVRVWNLINAYPVKWTGGDLNASSTEILTESLEIAHGGIAIQAVAA